MPSFRTSGVAARATHEPSERRSLLSYALAGLGVSALGIALAASVTLTTSAQPVAPGVNPAGPVSRIAAKPTPTPDPSAVAPFTGAAGTATTTPLREAIVAERAAQRAEELAKIADEVSRTARTATSKSRQEQLGKDGRATEAKGAQLAKEALDRAVAARVAAETARLAAEAAQQAAAQNGTRPGTTPAAPPPVPTTVPVSSGKGVAPVPNAVVGAGFGEYGLWSRYHTGLDFRAGHGTPIRAVKAGVVVFAGNSGDWAGNHVAVRHGDGMTTMSSHMSSMAVRTGQAVSTGQVIGYVGSTGRSFGAHLHFELYPAGVRYGDVYRAVSPIPWLRTAGVITR